MTRSGQCKLGGLGLIRLLKDFKQEANSIVGNPIYLSPEILRNEAYDQKHDIWALGIILYEMISFKPPFFNNDLGELHASICTQKYPPLPANCSFLLKSIVFLCL